MRPFLGFSLMEGTGQSSTSGGSSAKSQSSSLASGASPKASRKKSSLAPARFSALGPGPNSWFMPRGFILAARPASRFKAPVRVSPAAMILVSGPASASAELAATWATTGFISSQEDSILLRTLAGASSFWPRLPAMA